MFVIWSLALAALAAEPEAEIARKKGVAEVHILAPQGEHVAPDAPVSLDLTVDGSPVSASAMGAERLWFGLPGEAPWLVAGSLRLSLCTDDGSACQPHALSVEALLEKPKGRVLLELSQALVPAEPRPALLDAPEPEEALVRAMLASRDGLPVLVDFSALWCPPCNSLAAEVLDTPEVEEIAHVVMVDADLPASWALKDRYQVGAYPTMVMVDSRGQETSRLVGYPGREATLAWIRAGKNREPIGSRLTRLTRLDGRERGELALDLVSSGDEEGARQALEGATGLDAHLARVALDGQPESVRWVATQAPERLADHLWPHTEAVRAQPVLREAVLTALGPVATQPEHAEAALELCAELSQGHERALYYASLAALLREKLTGEPLADRGRWSSLAWALEQAGDPEGAVAVLQEAREAYPDEFTYHYALAGVEQRRGELARAKPAARRAQELATGDMVLRASLRLAELLEAQGNAPAALGVIDEALAGFEAPGEEVEVRTHRYLKALREKRVELLGEPPTTP